MAELTNAYDLFVCGTSNAAADRMLFDMSTKRQQVEYSGGAQHGAWHVVSCFRPQQVCRKQSSSMQQFSLALRCVLLLLVVVCSILVVSVTDLFMWRDQGFRLLVASFGASAVLLYGVPESKLSQPRNLIGKPAKAVILGHRVVTAERRLAENGTPGVQRSSSSSRSG